MDNIKNRIVKVLETENISHLIGLFNDFTYNDDEAINICTTDEYELYKEFINIENYIESSSALYNKLLDCENEREYKAFIKKVWQQIDHKFKKNTYFYLDKFNVPKFLTEDKLRKKIVTKLTTKKGLRFCLECNY